MPVADAATLGARRRGHQVLVLAPEDSDKPVDEADVIRTEWELLKNLAIASDDPSVHRAGTAGLGPNSLGARVTGREGICHCI